MAEISEGLKCQAQTFRLLGVGVGALTVPWGLCEAELGASAPLLYQESWAQPTFRGQLPPANSQSCPRPTSPLTVTPAVAWGTRDRRWGGRLCPESKCGWPAEGRGQTSS